MSNKPLFVCTKCGADHFKTRGGLSCHYTRVHPYVPPPPPEKKFTSYKSIVKGGDWGRHMTEAERKSPQREELRLGYLAHACELLEGILTELQKPRTIR